MGRGHDDHNHGHGGDDHEEGLTPEAFKIIMLFAMFFCCGFGILPKVCEACRKSENVLSMLNCFSGGLFLGMALTHMMPESEVIYREWAVKEGIERPFPLPYVMFFMGYLLILAVDRVVTHACGVKPPNHERPGDSHS